MPRTDVTRRLPSLRRRWHGLAALAAAGLLLAAPGLRAAAVAEAAGTVDTQPGRAHAEAQVAGGAQVATADRSTAALQVDVAANVPGFFTCCRVGSKAGLSSDYTVQGLDAAGQVVTFTWEATGAMAWSTENASIGTSFLTGIFSKAGMIYIHEVGWGISFVDGPVFMGDYAGTPAAPVGRGGHAGPAGVYAETVPAGAWDGRGTVRFQTHWLLADGWSGTLYQSVENALVGDVTASLSLRLVSLTTGQLAGPAALVLDNGVALPIVAMPVPEPASAWLLLAGLGLTGVAAAARSRRVRSAG